MLLLVGTRARLGCACVALGGLALVAVIYHPARRARARFADANRAINRNDLQTALRLLDEAVELDPSFVEALLRRARARHVAGETEAALRDVDRAVEVAPPTRTPVVS